jgi:hypothetical protein
MKFNNLYDLNDFLNERFKLNETKLFKTPKFFRTSDSDLDEYSSDKKDYYIKITNTLGIKFENELLLGVLKTLANYEYEFDLDINEIREEIKDILNDLEILKTKITNNEKGYTATNCYKFYNDLSWEIFYYKLNPLIEKYNNNSEIFVDNEKEKIEEICNKIDDIIIYFYKSVKNELESEKLKTNNNTSIKEYISKIRQQIIIFDDKPNENQKIIKSLTAILTDLENLENLKPNDLLPIEKKFILDNNTNLSNFLNTKKYIIDEYKNLPYFLVFPIECGLLSKDDYNLIVDIFKKLDDNKNFNKTLNTLFSTEKRIGFKQKEQQNINNDDITKFIDGYDSLDNKPINNEMKKNFINELNGKLPDAYKGLLSKININELIKIVDNNSQIIINILNDKFNIKTNQTNQNKLIPVNASYKFLNENLSNRLNTINSNMKDMIRSNPKYNKNYIRIMENGLKVNDIIKERPGFEKVKKYYGEKKLNIDISFYDINNIFNNSLKTKDGKLISVDTLRKECFNNVDKDKIKELNNKLYSVINFREKLGTKIMGLKPIDKQSIIDKWEENTTKTVDKYLTMINDCSSLKPENIKSSEIITDDDYISNNTKNGIIENEVIFHSVRNSPITTSPTLLCFKVNDKYYMFCSVSNSANKEFLLYRIFLMMPIKVFDECVENVKNGKSTAEDMFDSIDFNISNYKIFDDVKNLKDNKLYNIFFTYKETINRGKKIVNLHYFNNSNSITTINNVGLFVDITYNVFRECVVDNDNYKKVSTGSEEGKIITELLKTKKY